MPLDIASYLRKFALAVPVVGGMGAGLATPHFSWATAEADASVRCQSKIVVPASGPQNEPIIKVGFGQADPDWSDLYQACLKDGLYCYRLCNDLVSRAAPPQYAGAGTLRCELACDKNAEPVAVIQYSTAVPGRRPEGFEGEIFSGPGTSLGAWFAQAAVFEHAAIHAFGALEQDLKAHSAPRELLQAAQQARRDEARHHRLMRLCAEREGVAVPRRLLPSRSVRSLEQIALENATEGCVGETYAAAQALVQARLAQHEWVREVMTEIAADEVKHAELAWAVDSWISECLSDEQRMRVKRAQLEAAQRLAAALALPVEPQLVAAAGLPDAAQSSALAAWLTLTVWS